MVSPIDRFFGSLAEAGHIATFERETATIRFDLLDRENLDDQNRDRHERVEHWYLTMADGEVTVTRQDWPADDRPADDRPADDRPADDRPADAIVRARRPDFEAIVTGRLNAQAAILRGLVTCEGNMAAVVMFQRCLPGPPGSTGRVAPISARTVMAQRRDA